jgi:hypothetical protein
MRTQQPWVLLLAALLLCNGLASSAHADFQFLIPNGNPTGPQEAISPVYNIGPDQNYWFVVQLAPLYAEAVIVPTGMPGGPPALVDVLNAQGYGPQNGWTINRFDLQGSLSLGNYLAWAENKPAFSQGNLPPYQPFYAPGYGGAGFSLGYNPVGTDPSGADAHWLQVVITNKPLGDAVGVQYGDYTYYLDNGGNLYGNPWYAGPSNPTDMEDRVSRAYSSDGDWKAETFIASWDQQNKILSISNQAIYWGFIDPVVPVPEPSTLTLSLTALFAGFLHRIRRHVILAK